MRRKLRVVQGGILRRYVRYIRQTTIHTTCTFLLTAQIVAEVARRPGELKVRADACQTVRLRDVAVRFLAG